MDDIPKRIWLQWHGDGSPEDPGDVDPSVGVTWATDRVYKHDIEYVRATEGDTMTIENDTQMRQVLEQITHMYGALVILRREVEPQNARQFAVMAEGLLNRLRELRAEVDAYVGIPISSCPPKLEGGMEAENE